MGLNDPLANALSSLMNGEKVSKKTILVRPVSNTIKQVLQVLNENGYVGTFEEAQDSKGNCLTLNLLGRINKCGAVKPRFPVTKDTIEKYENRYLPAKDFGIIIVSTSQGIMSHKDAKKKGIGGKLLAYCY